MIQLNLLPDVKQQYIKTKRTRRLITMICLTASAVSLAATALLFTTTDVWQQHKINGLTEDIQTQLKELQDVPQLSKILTVQEQLNGLDTLHSEKYASTRLFGYLGQILPEGVSLSDMQVDFALSSIELTGRADSLQTINKFVDTLKFTNYVVYELDTQTKEVINQQDAAKAFGEVVLSSSNKTESATSFIINAKFDPTIFETTVQGVDTNRVKLVVPKVITTRSETENPSAIFDAPAEETK
ncbi:hypothetical protein KC878_04540 [Candidatus Saccharibacteria bacterium]|nr:hypothetical protein [Candidatus Saccharibacteria bacterium]MCB9821229.1 hypothetical protein [Candidatus Nomurabacteria bacterium]